MSGVFKGKHFDDQQFESSVRFESVSQSQRDLAATPGEQGIAKYFV